VLLILSRPRLGGHTQLIVNVHPDDLVESVLGGEAQAQRPRRFQGRAQVSTMRMIDASGSRRIRYFGSFWHKEL
jgi:hypothetical protein